MIREETEEKEMPAEFNGMSHVIRQTAFGSPFFGFISIGYHLCVMYVSVTFTFIYAAGTSV